jgi:hypothetical protein
MIITSQCEEQVILANDAKRKKEVHESPNH